MTAKKGTTMRMKPDQKLAWRAWACSEMFKDIVEADTANWNTYSSSEKLHQLWTHLVILNHIRALDRMRMRIWKRSNRMIDFK